MAGANLIVFRDSSRQIGTTHLAAELIAAVDNIRLCYPESAIDALILAGQIESSVCDCDFPCSDLSCMLTDALAEIFVRGATREISFLLSLVSQLKQTLPECIRISEPEGFAYYALHPADFADAVESSGNANSVGIVGIRSIGTTLSAIAKAQLQKQHITATRTTVRPVGHPYDRQTYFTSAQTEWIRQHTSKGSEFLVLDEGPGLSGSSFLSVAESLLKYGVEAEKISLIGTRESNANELCAKDAVQRWSKFAWRKVSSRVHRRFSDHLPLSGGLWRAQFIPSSADWPPSWMGMETLRFFAGDRSQIVKFEGLGRAGKNTLERARGIFKAGFGPAVHDAGDGMHSYQFIEGSPLTGSALSSDLLDRIAKYCAFRANGFACSVIGGTQVRETLEFNFAQEIGHDLNLPEDIFKTATPVLADGRMQPHEWILAASGIVLKVDAVQHGDDHFLPGPIDITWDLAGAIVEWGMCDDAAQHFCERYRHYSGVGRVDRLPYFILAYSTFRLAYCTMAMQATRDSIEVLRFRKACQFYKGKARAFAATIPHALRH